MEIKRILWLLLVTACCSIAAQAQSQAALEKLQQRYDAAQLADLQVHTHHKYVGMQLFYAASFQVLENGQPRAATEDEIRRISLDAYNSLRQEKADVSLHDATLQKDIVLLSRHNFEQVVLQNLSQQDLEAYQAYKAQTQHFNQKGN